MQSGNVRGCAAVCFALLLLRCATAGAGETYTTVDPPGSTQTEIFGINDSGTVAGDYDDDIHQQHGFLRTADGTITSFDPSGSTGTYVAGINSGGAVTGWYFASDIPGFLRAPDGTITIFGVAGATETIPTGINDRGAIAGWYVDDVNYHDHGFVRSVHGEITIFDAPDAFRTIVVGINNGARSPGLTLIRAALLMASCARPMERSRRSILPDRKERIRPRSIARVRLPERTRTARAITPASCALPTERTRRSVWVRATTTLLRP